MNIENYKEAITNADTAFSNQSFETAVKWYDKALEEAPQDEYALSKAGTALISLGKFEEAFGYFQRACDADPTNGDNLFNMGNAYFFSGDIAKAIEYYNAAELKKCSPDVQARIYYQLALMCTVKQDYSAALANYQKYEDSDPTGKASLDTDIISEKVQLYLKLEDYQNALKYAVKWKSLDPANIAPYVVCFNLLMTLEDYEKAQDMLDQTEKYAVKDETGKFAVDASRANFYATAAGSSIDTAGDFNQKAYDLMSELIVSPLDAPDQKNELVLALAELDIKMGKIDEAIDLLNMFGDKPQYAAPAGQKADDAPVDPAEIDAMLTNDLQAMDSKLANGEIDESIGENASINYDENGQPVREYPEGVFDDMPAGFDPEKFGMPSPEEYDRQEAEARAQAAAEFKTRIDFMMLSCYAFKEEFEKALEYASAIKNTKNNPYYACFGRYSEAFAIRQLALKGKAGYTMEQADKKYEEEIAFFRGEMLKKNGDAAYALIFRTRMYAELGKYDKAAELSELMAEDDKKAILEYIETCRREEQKG